MSRRYLTLTVTGEQAGRTVDTLLRRELCLSGTGIKRAKGIPGGILLDETEVYVNRIAEAGQVLAVLVGDLPGDNKLIPVSGPLEIVFEDEDILILNKMAGVAVHPGPDHYDDTLGNFVTHYYQTLGINAMFRPVNRLDRGTSGLMVVAKHAYAQERLKQQLHTETFRRYYLAVCEGVPKPLDGEIVAPIGRSEGSALRREIRPDGAVAKTRYRTLHHDERRALVQLELETGRTHQIRVHMAFLGCPLTGDFLYGVEQPERISRAALHSASLILMHPVSGKTMRFNAPVPKDMRGLFAETLDPKLSTESL